ncbi:hypothetical protein EC973_004342 [Apophysomyces ossiformis]|uniref:Receptor ligand binding region domain-containing protein n=1 Tax=Apophysomyces ossiformis TaxID=679940 RepID=A0A8H7BKM6_9FUNG|nr:hypothetical protein EC973_004342 [Apophysomyces ossiformis]
MSDPESSTGNASISINRIDYDETLSELSRNSSWFRVTSHHDMTYLSPHFTENLTEIKIGVLLPFRQDDNLITRTITLGGTTAIRMAAAEINSKQLIPGAYITLVEKDSYPGDVDGQAAITQAVFSAVALIQDGVVGVIGDISSSWTTLSALMTSTLQIPQCSFTAGANSLSDKSQYPYFFRTVPTRLLYADAALSFIVNQGWPAIGVLYTNSESDEQLSESLVAKAKMQGVLIKAYEEFYKHGPNSDIQASIDNVMKAGARIIFLAAEDDAQLTALTVAAHAGYINNETVWISTGTITDSLYLTVNRFNEAMTMRINKTEKRPPNSTIEYAAQRATSLSLIDYNSTFSGGLFTFETRSNLTGYPPFDQFLTEWATYNLSSLDQVDTTEGLAYSCLMAMSQGFIQALHNSTNTSTALQQLAAGKLGHYFIPEAFNSSYMGPVGPLIFDDSGDAMTGNFYVYNVINGVQVEIGTILGGQLQMTQQPLFHDGTTKMNNAGKTQHLFLGY